MSNDSRNVYDLLTEWKQPINENYKSIRNFKELQKLLIQHTHDANIGHGKKVFISIVDDAKTDGLIQIEGDNITSVANGLQDKGIRHGRWSDQPLDKLPFPVQVYIGTTPAHAGQRVLREASEGGFKLNTLKLSLAKAREYAEKVFQKVGKNLDEELPNFDTNYEELKKKNRSAKNVSRIKMPVIEPSDMAEFDNALKTGAIDIFKPFAKGKFTTPEKFSNNAEGDKWVHLGFEDADKTDDPIIGKWTQIAAKNLLPLQGEIWLEKLINDIVKWGVPKSGSPVLNTTIIVSKEGYILDGHHRFGQVMLADPNLKMQALKIPLPIDTLLKIGKSYGEAIGNEPKGRLREGFEGPNAAKYEALLRSVRTNMDNMSGLIIKALSSAGDEDHKTAIRLWGIPLDVLSGEALNFLTHHKKSVAPFSDALKIFKEAKKALKHITGLASWPDAYMRPLKKALKIANTMIKELNKNGVTR